MIVHIVTDGWHWGGDWKIDAIYASREAAEGRVSELRSGMDEFERRNGKEYDIEEWEVA